MANKKNVKANKKNTEIKNKKSNELEQKKPTQKKKRRLHSHLKVNIPLFQSLMMILPSLAKHAAAESIDNSSDAADQVTANNVTEKDVTDDHSKADSSAVALQEAQTSDSDVNSTLNASHAAHGSSSHLVPSHHLSTLSHPQVHYIPSVSMPTISSGSNGQPTHSNAPTTPALPVTFMPEVIKGTYGELHVDANGQYTFVLNPNSPQYILLNQHQPGTDHFALHLSNGSSIIVQIPVTGKQDTPSISGDLTGVVTEDHNIDSQGLLHANGKIDVIDPDQNESSVTPEVISGKYGSLTIDADGHWQYQVDNSLSNVQALTAATSLHESFTIHTKDGTPKIIDMTIGGNDDNAVITGVDAGTLTEDLTTQVQGQLSVTDSDLGEDHFQASQVTSNFGTLSITKDGAWTYNLDNNNPVVQKLGQGSTATDIVTVHSADGTAHQVMVTINGTNDHAVITSSTANSPSSFFAIGTSNGSSQVTEDKDLTVSGQLNITDIDSKEAHFSNSDLKGTLGTLHLKDNGDWSYDLDNNKPQVQALGKGSSTTDIITVHSADGTPHQITVTVNGTNDKAVISGTSAGVVTEESQLQTSGILTVTDVDTGEAHFATSSTGSTDIAGSFGTLHLTDTGSWTYDLDNTNPTVQALGKGSTATDTITVHSADGTPHQVTITVNGTNDAATVSSATVAIDETNKAVTTSGSLTSTDLDNPDNAFTPGSISGTNGDLTIDANGHWVFTASNAFNQLNVGDKVEETFTVSSIDGTPSTIKVTINGTNDAATVSTATVSVDETDSAITTSGTLTSIDVDNPDNTFTPDSISGTNGDLTIDANGHWVFTANSAFNQLNVGDKVEETFTVSSIDGTPSTIKVTINGTNDAATVSSATVAIDETDKAVTTSGTLTSTDVDNPDNAFQPDSISGTNGNLTIDANGHWSFTANSAFNQLNVGDKIEETFTVSSVDGTPSTIKVTINGTNDAATVSTATVSVDETDKAVTTSGTLTSTDVDNPDNTFTPDSIVGANGDLTIDANGHWVFTANSAFNQLNVGDKVEETFTVSSVDGTPSTIKVTINGTNDAATVSSATVAIDETDKAITTSGTLTSTDVDNPDNAFTPDAISGTNGDLTIDANGHWVFTANSAFNQLNIGDKVEETFTVSSIDGTPSTIKVTINGTNDAATVSSATVAIDETDKAVTTSGTLTSTDVDNPDNTFTPDSISGTNGDLTIDANGHWVFTANSTFNQLNVGDKVEETFTVSSVDGTASTIKVAINGTNDAATVSSATVAIDETDRAVTTSGTLTSTDVDNPDNTFTPDSISGTNGDLTIDTTGHWVFTANSAFNQLNVGDKVEETFTVSSVDGTPSTIKVTINGTNDTATVSSATVATAETDKAVTTSGTLTSTDVDNPDNTFTPDSISGTNGDLTIDANGHWVFTANSAFNQLNVGDKVEETFTVSSVDGTPSTIKVTINGTNDKATVSTATVSVDETDSAITTSGTLTSTDVDNPDNTFTPDSISGTNGDLTIDANGHWVFTANSAFNQLNVGDKVEETFTMSSIDGTPSTIKVTINGTNDAATVSSATVAIDETDKVVTTSGTLTSTDVDNPDNTFTPDSISGTNGDLTIDANGHWMFTANSAFNQLNVGDKVEETFTVSSVDGTASTIKVTINGTNDDATVSSATVAIDETDKAVTTSGTLTSIDVDNPDNAFTPDSITGTNGNLTIGANGQWTFTANSAFNKLNVGDKVEETFTVSSVDGTPSTIKVTINGTNDAATVSSATVAIDETDKAVTTSGTLTSTDVDNPDNTFTPDSISGTNGDLTIDANGHWVFTANSAFNQLNVGDKVEETFTVSSIDGTASTIKVTINGTNDKATVSTATVSVDETDKAVTTSGTLTSTDVDNPDNAFTPDSITGTNGNLTIDANGHWTFTANNAFNQLNVGDKVEETFTVSSVDGTPSTIKVTINGTNDAATVSTATVSVDETDKAVTTSGTLTSTDVDNPDNTFTPDSIAGTNGDLTIDANGHWVFTANSAFNQLNVGDKIEETFTVSSIDGTASTIKVTINGTNDKATVSTATVSVDETDKAVTTSGTLTSTDVDNPDNAFTPDSISGTNGDLTIDANGHWVFTANSAFNQLNVGDKVEETFTVSSVDGTASTIKVAINGTNDAATVSSATVAIDETDRAVTTSGTLTSIDVDNPDNAFTPDSISGTNGDLTIGANGQWTFTANSAFNQLNVGDKVEETFTVTSVDGTPSTIKVTINGTNDAATVSSATVAIDETDKVVTTSGTLTSTDVDNPDNTFTPDSIVGSNGDLTIDANGHWVFTANNAFNQLNVGDKVEETFTVSSIDGTASTIKITINGTNDKAVISGTSAGAVTEESQLQTSGSLTVTDVDAGQAHFSNTDIAGTLGTLHLTNSGTWTYDLDNTNPTLQALGKGTTATDTITVHSADGTPHQITITVNGTNDKAIIGGTNSGAVTEESQLQTSGTLTVTDVDTGEAHFSNTDIAGTLGTLHLTDTGTWTYDLDNTNPQVQALGKGATATDTITVNSADGTPHQITITVNGTNDTAVIGGTSAGAVTEETQLQTSGSLTITDTDTGEAQFSNTDIKGSLGTLHLTDAGQWTYDLDNTNPTVQALGKGAATTDTITVTSADGTTHQVTIAVNGTNDKAVITGTNTGAVTEDQDLTNQLNVHPNYMLTQGKLFISDVDTNEATFPMQSGIVGDHGIGSFTLIPSGIWLFSADSKQAAVQALGVGDTLTESTTITSVDGTQKTILVTINGTNDAPVITPVATQTVTEDGSKTITFHATDIDTTDTLTPSVSATHGSASLNAQGEIVFTPDANYNGPASVVLSVTDGHTTTSQTINVDVTPANDAPVINPIVPVNATEDGAVVTGQLTSTDIDTGDTATFTTTSTQGGFTLNADGSYNLDPTDASFQHLKAGEISTFTIPVTVTDSAGATDTKDLVITVTGTNDTPVISGVDTGALKEDVSANPQSNELTATGKLDIVDIDTGEGSFVSHGFNKTALQGHYGKLEISQDGSWSYSADNSQTAIQSLGEGEQLTDTIKVTSKDGTTHDVVVTINGTNDKAVIGGSNTGAVTEESQLQTSGTLTVTDVDTGEAHFANTDIQGSLGTLHLTDNGAWTYDLDNTNPAVQALGNGATATDTITVHSADGTPHQVTITVNGTNDNAVVGGVDTASVTEKAAGDNMSPDHAQSGMATLRVSTLNANGHLSVIDPDSGQSGFADNNVGYNYHGTYGDLILNPNGDWNYYADAGSLTHIGGRPTTRGSAIDKLGEGETLTDTITVHTKDGTPHNIVITINGSNDRPYCSSEVQLNAGTEDTRQTITAAQLLQNSIDVDKNDSGLLTVANLHPDHGSILDNQNGTYTFTPEKDYNGKVHFTYDVKDAHGGVTHTGATSSLSAVADKAVISGSDTGTIIEDHNVGHSSLQPVVASGLLSVTDPDAGQDHFQVNLLLGEQAIHDPFGGFLRITPSGAWGYEVANSRLQSLAEGEVEKVVYRVYSADHTAHDITITVTGTNDQPTITATTLAHGTEDTHYQMQASQFGFSDIDTGDTLHSIAITDLPSATQGKFVLDGHDVTAGQHISTADITKLQFVPAQDFNGDVQFKYTVNDGHTDSAEATNTLHIDAVGDKAVISGVDTGDVYENRNPDMSPDFAQSGMAHLTNSMIHVEGQLTIIDPDTGENSFDSKGIGYTYHGKYGHLILNTDGKWFYGVATGTADVNGGLTTNVGSTLDQLGANETLTDTITIQSKDGTTHDIVITIHGDNDRPYCSSEVQLNSGKEDLAQTITATELLANTIDVDSNDLGKLTIENLLVDHGSVVDNKDGTYTFTPTKDYNGQVHFSYDVTDAHGGTTHTGANTSLAAVNDAATFAGDSSSIKEDTNIHHNAHITGSATIPDALSCHGHLIVSDADGHGEAALDLKGQPKISLNGTYGHFDITSTGIWVYKADNKSTQIQDLDNGQTLTDSIEVTSKDGTKHSITVTINGTTDDPVLHSLSDSGVQHSGPVEGNLLTGSGTDQGLSGAATDTDSNAHLVLQDIQIKDPVSGYVAVRPGQPHTMAGIGTLAIEANGHYTFTPEAGFTGKVPSMVYRVGDDGGNPIGDSSQNSLSIEVTPPLQHAPTVTGQTVSTNEDITRTITTSEFGYSDQDGDALQFVTISSIPSHGLLLLNGNAVTANQQISKADLDAGHLTFTPNNNENGANYAQFTFTANDGHKNSAGATMVVDVNAVNDAPIVGSSFISSLEDKPHAFTTADFKYSDIDGDALNHIAITNVAHGVLSLNGTTVNVGDNVSASDVSSLIFTPTHNYFSSGVSGLGAVQFTANDGHLDSKEGSILINIASVADPATFSGDSTGVAKEDITLQASGTLTASDPDGTTGFTTVQGGAGIAGSKGYGHAHIDVNGHWTYDLDNNHPIVQQLGEGQTDTETITVQSADGTHHDIVVTITGTNDAPILGVNQTSSTAGTLTETDVDVNDTHTFSIVSSTGQFGSLSVDPNTGDYIYTPNTSITGMSYNSATNSYHGVDVFEVKVSDGHTEDSKFITFDASGHVTMSPTVSLVTSTTVPHQPVVTATQPTLPSGTNVAPTNTVTLDLASTSDSGSSQTDNLTNDTTPTITGHTDIPFSKVTIYDGSTPVGHSVSDASGQYSVAVSSLSEGDHNLSAKALAPSSVLPATSSLLSVHIDTQVHVGIQTDPITADNVINAQESNSSIDITGSVSGDYNAGDIVTLDVNGTQHTGVVDAKGHYSIAVPGSELIADADQKIEASVAVTDSAGNSAHATADVTYQVDTQVSVPTITFENAGADNLYSKAEIARGQANTITATVTPPGDAKIGEHLVVNGQDHVLDAHTLQHGIQIEVHPGSNVQATMTDEHGNTAGSQGFAASAIPEPIIVRPPSGSHQVSGTLGVPPLLPSLTPVPTAQSGWRIHLPNGQYVTSHHGQYGTLTIDPQTGHLHYQEQAQVHTGPHGSASGIGQHEDKFEVALQGSNQDEVVAHVNIQILSHGPGNSGKLTVGTEVVDMTITPLVHTSHPAPPPPPPVQHDEPDMASQADFTVTLSDDSNLDLTQQTHQEPDQKTSHHGAAAYLDALGIKPDTTSTTVHDQPADMDIILAQVDQPDAATHDQAHLDMSDALEHHDANINHNQDDEHHHNDIDGLPDIDPNS
ncbi:VCBS domain-containing protein [Vibrio splendidus]|uniref:VCBS domain-containing protein n=3 Tax=Vibrio TaxID=662 RepID=UPI0012FFEC97|nr:VCBS domain-containing protein [Vibrio splendidus]